MTSRGHHRFVNGEMKKSGDFDLVASLSRGGSLLASSGWFALAAVIGAVLFAAVRKRTTPVLQNDIRRGDDGGDAGDRPA